MSLQNVSGITIHNLTTGQAAVSTCAGNVRMHNPSGSSQSYSTDAGTGHRCTTGDNESFQALASASHGAGPVELTISPVSPFLVDSLIRTASTNLGGTTAPTGGTWQATNNNLKETSAATGVQASNTTTGQINRCYNDVTPPSADYFAQVTVEIPLISNAHEPTIYIRWNHTSNNGYGIRYTGSSTVATLNRFTAGLATVLATGPTFTNGTLIMAIQVKGSSIRWWLNGVEQTPVTDSTYSAAGNVALFDSLTGIAFDTPMHNIFAQTV